MRPMAVFHSVKRSSRFLDRTRSHPRTYDRTPSAVLSYWRTTTLIRLFLAYEKLCRQRWCEQSVTLLLGANDVFAGRSRLVASPQKLDDLPGLCDSEVVPGASMDIPKPRF